MELIETEIFLHSHENGGRIQSILGRTDRSFYMPHIVIGDPNQKKSKTIGKDGNKTVSTEHYLGVRFQNTPDFEYLPIEKKIKVEMELIYIEKVDYDEAIEGATFTIREGARIIGYGKILNRRNEKSREPVGGHNSGGCAPSA